MDLSLKPVLPFRITLCKARVVRSEVVEEARHHDPYMKQIIFWFGVRGYIHHGL